MANNPDTYVLIGHTMATIYYAGTTPRKAFAEIAIPAEAYARYTSGQRPMDVYDRQGHPANFDEPDTGCGFTL
jgi:hypothetical protein